MTMILLGWQKLRKRATDNLNHPLRRLWPMRMTFSEIWADQSRKDHLGNRLLKLRHQNGMRT